MIEICTTCKHDTAAGLDIRVRKCKGHRCSMLICSHITACEWCKDVTP